MNLLNTTVRSWALMLRSSSNLRRFWQRQYVHLLQAHMQWRRAWLQKDTQKCVYSPPRQHTHTNTEGHTLTGGGTKAWQMKSNYICLTAKLHQSMTFTVIWNLHCCWLPQTLTFIQWNRITDICNTKREERRENHKTDITTKTISDWRFVSCFYF